MTAARLSLARRALSLLDLTDLNEQTTEDATDALCARALRPVAGEPRLKVAAVCVWPRFVARARERLGTGPVKIATVANFPSGREDAARIDRTVSRALADGADEIDLVLDYAAFRAGRKAVAARRIERVKRGLPGSVWLKVILETGELGDADTIRAAARLAVNAGADFLKTSTGKVKVNATLSSARILLEVALEAGRPVGVKPSGGIRTLDDAASYLALADKIMGEGWARPDTFRFGASGLLDDLVATIEGRAPGAPGKGY